MELQRKLHALLPSLPENQRDVLIVVHPEVMQRLRKEDAEHLMEIERRHLCRLTFRADAAFHREKIVIADANNGTELVKSGA